MQAFSRVLVRVEVVVAALASVLVVPATLRTSRAALLVVVVVVVQEVPVDLLCHRQVPTVLQRQLPKALAKLRLPVTARIPVISNVEWR
uniref:Putative secreted peptide n=1 Tax=Anopheles braziliensis TaxID=58242 RepID=A0A2M3ZUX6_9DIPT